MNYYFVIKHKKNLSNVKWKIDKDEKYTMLKQQAHKQQHDLLIHNIYQWRSSFIRKINSHFFSQEQICSSQDILDENGIIRVSITVAALVAVSTNPKSSAV